MNFLELGQIVKAAKRITCMKTGKLIAFPGDLGRCIEVGKGWPVVEFRNGGTIKVLPQEVLRTKL